MIDKSIQLTQTTTIEYPAEEKEKRFAIRRVDWNRIKREVEYIQPEPKFLRTTYSASFGAAITAGATIIPIYYIPQKSPWLLPTFFCFAAFTFILAIILLCVDKYHITSKSKDLELIREDMQDIEDTFKRETGEEIEDEMSIIQSVYSQDSKNRRVTKS